MCAARRQINLRSVAVDGPDSDAESTAPLDGELATATLEPDGRRVVGPSLSDIDGQLLFAQVRERMFARASELKVGRYRIRRRLGAGAMGEVHLAVDEDLDRPIAIKFVHRHLTSSWSASQRWAERLRQEARALARLAHANVVHVYEVGEFEGRVYLAMEYIEGTSLRDWIRNERPTWEQVLEAYLAAARGLAAAHGAGVVHRDFKPDNVLRGEDGRIAVADFGLAAVEQRSTLSDEPGMRERQATLDDELASYDGSGEIKGTPAYMPPEQFEGRADPRADQFALCVSLFEGLWERRPFPKRSIPDVLRGHVDWVPFPPPRKTAVASWLWPILRRGLAPAPKDRWGSVDELIAAIERARLVRRKRARWLISGAAALGVGLLSGAGVALLATPELPDQCATVDTELDGTWDTARRNQLLATFADAASRSGGSWLGDSGDLVATGFDRWRDAWQAARMQVCRARAGGDPIVLDRQGACLERQRRAAAATIDLLIAGTPEALREAPLAVQSLADPRACEHEARLGGPPAPAPAIADAVERVREELAVLEAERVTGQLTAARARGARLEQEARALDYAALQAEIALVYGHVLLNSKQGDRGLEVLEQSVDLAEASHHDRIAAEAWRWMATYAATEGRQLEPGRRWLRRADAAARRIGVEPLDAARLDAVRGYVQVLSEDASERGLGIEQLEQVTLALEQGGDLVLAAQASSALGVALLDGVQIQRTLAAFERTLGLLERLHGPRHPEVGWAAHNFGQALLEVGNFEDAQPLLQRAVDVWTAGQSVGGHELGRAQFVLAQVELSTGDFQRVLDRALTAAVLFEQSLEPDRVEHAEVAVLIGTAHYFLGQPQPAVEAYRRAVDGAVRVHGPDDVYTGYYRIGLGWALLAAGEVEAARAEFSNASATMEGKAEAGNDEIVDARLGSIAVDVVAGSLGDARAKMAEFTTPPTLEFNLVTFELLHGLIGIRSDSSDTRAAAALGRARALARSDEGGEALLEVLLDSLHADSNERQLAG